ncbi:MAG TPA: hypothetical protein VJ964_00500 [Balneolaceae bacterium]|nr:hypothetical protein [Balneolaceae bacterium]
MIAKIFRTLLFLLLPVLAMGQSLNLSVTSPTSNNNRSTFLLKRGEVTINNGQIRFHRSNKTVDGFTDYGISPDLSKVSLLKWGGGKGHVIVFDSMGDTLTTYSTISLADQSSFGIYPQDNGDIMLRDKIADFTFFNTFGDIITNMSNSSQSKEGEAISEVATSPGGETLVVFNPKIKRNGKLGSKAQVRLSDGTFRNIFYSSDRYLKNVVISNDGDMIAAVTAASGGEDKVLLMDKYGNNINSITSKDPLDAVSFSDEGQYVTLNSGGSVTVYSTEKAKRVGGTSFRETVFMANYFPEDDLILAITGDYSKMANALGNVKINAVNLRKRSIADHEFSGVLGFSKAIAPKFIRTSADRYELEGASKEIKIESHF